MQSLLLVLIALASVGLAQPFKREPLLKVDFFVCDGVQVLFVDRTAECAVGVLYRPDPTVGLESIAVTFVEDCYTASGRSCKKVLKPVVFSKGSNPFEVWDLQLARVLQLYPFQTTEREIKRAGYSHLLLLRFKYRIEHTVEYYDPGILGLFSSYRRYQKDERVQQVRAKLSFRFANGIEFPREARITVRY